MSSSSSSDSVDLAAVFSLVLDLKRQLREFSREVIEIKQVCHAIHAVLQSDEDLEVDMDDDSGSDVDEPSRVRVGSLASLARPALSRSNAGSLGSAVPLSVDVEATEASTQQSSAENPTQPHRTLYRFR